MKVYKEKEEEKKDWFLNLEELDDGEVILCAVDKDGDKVKYGNILVIQNDGALRLCNGCKVKGLQTDLFGHIKISYG